ncbi:hypothetical protein Bca101_083118 [Brassica carinata]
MVAVNSVINAAILNVTPSTANAEIIVENHNDSIVNSPARLPALVRLSPPPESSNDPTSQALDHIPAKKRLGRPPPPLQRISQNLWA